MSKISSEAAINDFLAARARLFRYMRNSYNCRASSSPHRKQPMAWFTSGTPNRIYDRTTMQGGEGAQRQGRQGWRCNTCKRTGHNGLGRSRCGLSPLGWCRCGQSPFHAIWCAISPDKRCRHECGQRCYRADRRCRVGCGR